MKIEIQLSEYRKLKDEIIKLKALEEYYKGQLLLANYIIRLNEVKQEKVKVKEKHIGFN